jgi:DNA-binding transcriptional MerR regulator
LKLIELIEAAGGASVTPRFVRFLISEGVIGPPSGGRAHASYDAEHLRGIVHYVRLRDLGFSLTQIREILKAERGETVPVELVPGVVLHIDLARLDRTTSAAAVAERTHRVLAELLTSVNTGGKRNDDDVG